MAGVLFGLTENFNEIWFSKMTLFQHSESSDGEVDGNENCKDTSTDNAVDCPGYANKACYMANSVSYDSSMNQKVITDRGCSTFIIKGENDENHECMEASSGGSPIHTCKPELQKNIF